MSAAVNGVERSRGNSSMGASFGELIAAASRNATLFPGDIIASGTVGGGCLAEQTRGLGPWLEVGDEVELTITGLGSLKNHLI